MSVFNIGVTTSIAAGISALAAHQATKAEKGLPPGPPGVPILGNLLDFPKKWPHYQFTEWGEYVVLVY